MSFEMHPSPVTGLRRRNDDDNRDTVRADPGGDREQVEVDEVDDKDDMGDNWLQFIGSSRDMDVMPRLDLIEETLKGG